MKPKFCRFSLVSALLPVFLGSQALVGAFTWNAANPTGSGWDVAANWTPNTGYPSVASDTAVFNQDFITATYAVSLNTGVLGSNPVVIDSLSVTDTATATAFDFNINTGTGTPSLTFNTAAPTIYAGLASGKALTINPTVNLNTSNSILGITGAANVTISNPGASFFSNLNPTGGLNVAAGTLRISNAGPTLALAALKTGAGALQLNLTNAAIFSSGTIGGTGAKTLTNVRSFADASSASQTLINASTSTLDMQIDPGSGPAFFTSLSGVSSTTGNYGTVILNNIVGTINLVAKSFDTSTANAKLILSGNGGLAGTAVLSGGSIKTGTADLAIGEGITLNVDSSTGTFSIAGLVVTSNHSSNPSTGGEGTVNWSATGKTVTGSLGLGVQGGGNCTFNMLGGSLTPGNGLDFGSTSHSNDNSVPVVNISAGTLAVPAGKNLSMSNVASDGAKVISTLNISGTGLLDLTSANAINLGTRSPATIAADTISDATINLNGGTLKLGKTITRVTPNANARTNSSATVQFYFNGGTLQAGAAVADVFTNFGVTNSDNDGIFVSSGGAKIDTQAFAMGIAANIQETTGSPGGSLIKTGTGTLSLSGTNTYTGGTFVNAGSVGFLKVAAKPATGTVTVADGATLGLGILGTGAFTAADVDNLFAHNLVGNLSNVTWSGAYSFGIDTTSGSTSYDTSVAASANGLSKVGTNTLTLTGTNLYTGPTTISSGVLSVAADANLGNGNAVVFDGGTLQVTGTALTNLNTHTVTGNATKTVALDINNAANTFTIGQALNQTTGGLTKVGAGNLVLTGTNTYSGGSSVTTGTLAFSGTGALPTSGVLTIVGSLTATATASIRNDGAGNNGTISLPTNNVLVTTAYGILNVANNGGGNTGNTVAMGTLSTPNATVTTTTFTGGNSYNLSFSGLTLPGTTGQTTTLVPTTTSLTIAGNVTNPMAGYGTGNYDTLVIDGTSTGNSITGVISNASGGTNTLGGYTRLTKSSTSTWTLAGASTYTGVTLINGGILKAGVASVANVSGAFGLNSAVTLANVAGTAMDLNGYSTQTGSLGGGGALGGNVTLGAATLTLGGDNGSNSYAGVISGTGGLTKIGTVNTGVQTLSAANLYTGDTTINGGRLALAAGATLASNQILLGDTSGSATAEWSIAQNGGYSYPGNITVRSGSGGGKTLTSSNTTGTNTLSGGVLLNTTVNLTQSAGGTLTLSGPLSGTSGGGIIVGGGGTVNLTGGGNFGGGTGGYFSCDSGTLNVTAPLTLSVSYRMSIGWNTGVAGTVNITGTTVTLSSSKDVSVGGGYNSSYSGLGILNIGGTLANPALLTTGTTTTTFTLGVQTGQTGSGTLNLNAYGTLETSRSITSKGVAGSAMINFDGGTIRLTGNQATLIGSGITATVNTGGATVDTNTFNGTLVSPLVAGTGTGGLTKLGTGTLTLSAASSYAGETVVSGGTLSLSQNNSLSNSSAVRLSSTATLNLNFSGTDIVDRLYLDGTLQAPGIWGGTGSSAPNKSALITGGGLLNVTNGVSAGYAGWETANGLTGAGATADSDHDGIANGIEFVIGGVSSGANTDSNALLIPPTVDATYLTYTFRRTSASAAYNPGVEYGSNLTGWTPAVAGEPALTPVLITVAANDFGAGIDRVTVKIPLALATGGKMFARLQVVIP